MRRPTTPMTALVTLVTASCAALVAATALPAYAAGVTRTDPRGDIEHPIDLRRLEVNHGLENLKITLTHRDLVRHPETAASGSVYIDTDRTDPGPELVFVGGLFAGTDYQLLTTERFAQSSYGRPVRCGDYKMRLRYDRDRTRIRIGVECLGAPDEVRVAARVSGVTGPKQLAHDWAGEPREFTDWLPAG